MKKKIHIDYFLMSVKLNINIIKSINFILSGFILVKILAILLFTIYSIVLLFIYIYIYFYLALNLVSLIKLLKSVTFLFLGQFLFSFFIFVVLIHVF